MDIIFVIAGLVLLYYGGDWLVQGSSRIATAFGISSLIIGLTIVAIGTSAPELFVSLLAVIRSSEDVGIALGNVVGSNIANIGLILGLTGMITPIAVHEALIKREIPIMLVVTLVASLFALDANLSRLEGMILLGGFIAFNIFFYRLAMREHDAHEAEIEALEKETGQDIVDPGDSVKIPMEIGRVIVGIIGLVIGAQLLVEGATNIAEALGVPQIVIGVTMVAFGTSLPELATSLTAAFKGESDIALGNVIGSNIANLLLVLGATVTIVPFEIEAGLPATEFFVMIAFSLLLIPFARNRQLSRTESGFFLIAYMVFIAYSFLA